MKRSIELNGVSALCLTKLDVLDGLRDHPHLHQL